jgi:hypothetical protein
MHNLSVTGDGIEALRVPFCSGPDMWFDRSQSRTKYRASYRGHARAYAVKCQEVVNVFDRGSGRAPHIDKLQSYSLRLDHGQKPRSRLATKAVCLQPFLLDPQSWHLDSNASYPPLDSCGCACGDSLTLALGLLRSPRQDERDRWLELWRGLKCLKAPHFGGLYQQSSSALPVFATFTRFQRTFFSPSPSFDKCRSSHASSSSRLPLERLHLVCLCTTSTSTPTSPPTLSTPRSQLVSSLSHRLPLVMPSALHRPRF